MWGVGISIIDLAGAVALLLWGIRMVQTGVQRAFGAQLKAFLDRTLRNNISALFAGMGVTAVLQSSTATGLMVVGFAGKNLIELVPALAVMLGANIGTTLIVQVLSFNVTAAAPALIFAGVVMFRRMDGRRRDFGRVLIGLGFVLVSLHQLVGALVPYEHAPGLRNALSVVTAYPLADIFLSGVLTWISHSSVAVILLVITFAMKGAIGTKAALALVLGANLGTAINPLLEGASGEDPALKRVPVGNLLNRLVGVIIAVPLLPWITEGLSHLESNPARLIADFHTFFNIVLALIFLPLLDQYAKVLCRFLPKKTNISDEGTVLYLNNAAKEAPFLALGCAAREAMRLADVLTKMLEAVRTLIDKDDRRLVEETRQHDNIVDRLNYAIKTYLISLDQAAMNQADQRRLYEILRFSTNMEHAGDVIDRNILGTLQRKIKRNVKFSPQGKSELLHATERLISNVHTAATLFMVDDARLARHLAAEKSEFRTIESMSMEAHFQRLREGVVQSEETSSLHLDLLRDLKQVNSHLVAAAAYPALERKGEERSDESRSDDDAESIEV